MVDPERSSTYREVLSVAEYRSVLSANLLSVVGDMLAKIAVAVLVFDRTASPLLSAAAFAIGYLPWVAGGPVLAAVADRMPWKRAMVGSDIIRMAMVGALAIPGIPLPLLLLLLFVSALFAPPFEAARSALMPEILEGDRYVVGVSLSNVSAQAAQLIGFVVGGPIVVLVSARGALVIDSATFLLSALLLQYGVRHRPARAREPRQTSIMRETADGLRLVFGNPVLRVYVLMVWLTSALVYAPEGLAAPLSAELDGGAIGVGLLLGASPLGTVIGSVLIGRFTTPARRIRWLRGLALLAVCALIPIAFGPPLWTVLALLMVSGFGMSYLLPLNALFVRALPASYRARGFGVVQAGLQAVQGLSIVLAGWAANSVDVRYVVAAGGVVGVFAVGGLSALWPSTAKARQPVAESARTSLTA